MALVKFINDAGELQWGDDAGMDEAKVVFRTEGGVLIARYPGPGEPFDLGMPLRGMSVSSAKKQLVSKFRCEAAARNLASGKPVPRPSERAPITGRL